MKKRWVAAGMLEAEHSFRRMRGFKDVTKVVELSLPVETPAKYDEAAA